MRIAVPAADGKLSMHFGHCDAFWVFEVDPESKQILRSESVTPPEHAPGVLPAWLAGKGVTLVIAGGMGMRAQQLFAESGVDVITGAPSAEPEEVVRSFLDDALELGENVCEH